MTPALPKRPLLPEEQIWLRVADPAWRDPLDPSYAARFGGRWNPPNSWPALYLNRDLRTARAQIARLLHGSPVEPEDLADDAYDLIAVALPKPLVALDVITDAGIAELGLPGTYPVHANGQLVSHSRCWMLAEAAHKEHIDGVECRSAATRDGTGREFAWWPADEARARQLGRRRRFGSWRHSGNDDTKRLFALP